MAYFYYPKYIINHHEMLILYILYFHKMKHHLLYLYDPFVCLFVYLFQKKKKIYNINNITKQDIINKTRKIETKKGTSGKCILGFNLDGSLTKFFDDFDFDLFLVWGLCGSFFVFFLKESSRT